jgi:cation diffusion facilitator CzcD-associated flavoprotein CzcO
MNNKIHTVVIIGTGFGGLSAAISLRKKGIYDFVMLERRNFAGGTWLQNTYPGAAVDVYSPLYSLSGHPYPWTHLFAKQKEIAAYTLGIIKQYALDELIQLNKTVKEAKWEGYFWRITLSNNEQLLSKIVINATGPLSTPVVPKFANIDKFKGVNFHCNDWPQDVDLANKTVAIIGSGASAIQIIPAIVNKVKKLHVVQRTPHWILPRPDWTIPIFLRKLFALSPIYTFIRWLAYWFLELRVIAFKYSRTLLNLVGTRPALRHLKRQIKNHKLREKLTPGFIIGCKRILISNTYYPALQQVNCTLHDSLDHIVEFTAKGIRFENSGEISLDAVIFATGYNAVDAMISYSVIGKNGRKLSSQWQEYPRAYLGTSMPNFPNYFVVTGPNTGIGHTSAIFVIESQLTYIMHCIHEITVNNALAIEPSETAENEYTAMIHREMSKTVWFYGQCSSWYQNAQGKVIAMFPGFTFTFLRMCKAFKPHHHIIKR